MQTNLKKLFDLAVDHRNQHDCSAYPYEDYIKLFEIVEKSKPAKILEIGTGMGFTAVIMQLANPESLVETIEKDQSHCDTAKKFIYDQGLSGRIIVQNEIAELLLPELNPFYDLIFFDGYQIHYEFLPHYLRLLRKGGILVLGNNHLTSKTSDKFFEEIDNITNWEIVDKFNDTIVLVRK